MRISVKRMVEVCAYLLYTLLVLLFMLWFQFPGKAVKKRVETELNSLTPGLYWNVGSIGLGLPADIRFNDIRVSRKAEEKKPLVVVDSLALRPDLAGWRKNGETAASYRLRLLDGGISGSVKLAADRNSFSFSSELAGIRVTKQTMGKLLQGYDREISGLLSGSFNGRGLLQPRSRLTELQGRVQLGKGEISLQEPVLGMESLRFNQLDSAVKYGAGKVQFSSGSMESKLLAAEFSGTVQPVVHAVLLSSLRINGSLTPRPEFLAPIGDAMTVNLLKKQLQQGKLPFIINGTLSKPGIVFSGLPADLNSQLQGRRK
jgi:type II secretion system protein N